MELRLELFVKNLERSIDFYKNLLGFTVVRKEPNYAVVKNGGVELGLGDATSLPSEHFFDQQSLSEQKGVGVEIVLTVPDVYRLYGEIKRRHYKLESELGKREWGLTDFRIADPDGYYLRLTSKS